MINLAANLFRRTLGLWVDTMRRGAPYVVALAVISAAGGVYYAATHIAMFTDTTDMLSKKLPFRHPYDAFRAAFPQLSDNIVIVIDGDNADVVAHASSTMASRLRAQPELFPYVFDPVDDPFFVRNGLLYLGVEELSDLSTRIAAAQPLLGTLAKDPSLRGLFEVLGLAAGEVADGNAEPSTLEKIFTKVDEAVAARLEGRPYLLSWREMMAGTETEEDLRHVIVVQPKLDYATLRPARAAIDAIRNIAAEIPAMGGSQVRVRLTGSAALQDEELESVSQGAGLAGFLSFALVTVLLLVGLRSTRLIVSTLVTLVIGLAWSATFAAVAIGHLNLISVTFAVLFIGVGVDFGIQFCLRYGEAIARGEETARALRNTAIGVGGALTLASGAAAIGFFAFVPTDYVGLSELGMIAGFSMFIAWFANLTVLPALLALMPLTPCRAAAPDKALSANGEPTLGFVLRHPVTITVGALLLGLAASTQAPRARFDFNPLNLNDPTTESVRTFHDLIRWDPSSAYTISILAPDLDAARALAGRLDKLPEVQSTRTLADFVPDHQDEKLAIVDGMALFLFPVLEASEPKAPPDPDQRLDVATAFRAKLGKLADSPHAGELGPAARRISQGLGHLVEKQGASGLIDLENSLLATLPSRLEQLRQSLHPEKVTLDDLPADLREREIAADGRTLVTVVPSADMSDNANLRRFVQAVQAVAPDATDNPVVILAAGDAVVHAFEQAGLYSAVGIVILLLLVMRNVVDTVFVLTPLALAAVLTIAFTVLFHLPFNFANIIALPLLLCLGVGYGIYLVLRHRATQGVAAVLATNTPRAVLFSALTTMCSFGTLAISHHRGTQSMGVLLFVSLSLALVCTLVVLPAMQELRDRRAARRARSP
ncbi:MAG TPA: MMPL family transporter [Alphaproteobacteria bacterium]|nr:MMPL family transporter [Alphaproteobacteria bacterium]